MLVRIFGRNFRSFQGDFELSMVAADYDDNRGVVEVPIKGMEKPLRLLRVAAIYGPNASGKSAVLIAARALHWFIAGSQNEAKPGSAIPPYEPFALDDESQNSPITLGCDVIYQSKILHYEIEYQRDQIISEELSLNSGNGSSLLLKRMGNKFSGRLIKTSSANQLYVKEMAPNVSVLSKLALVGPAKGKESVLQFYDPIVQATAHRNYAHATGDQVRLVFDEVSDRFESDEAYRQWVMDYLIRPADIGIHDVRVHREKWNIPTSLIEQLSRVTDKIPESQIVVNFLHSGDRSTTIEYKYESSGTKKLFNISDEFWQLAHNNRTLFADELSASLHPRILDQLIRTVNDPKRKDIQSQLIFATHDTGLLEGRDGLPPVLRRDQVYFTQKNNGASELYSLAEFKDEARPVHNIRKRYLSGLYGALPIVEKLGI